MLSTEAAILVSPHTLRFFGCRHFGYPRTKAVRLGNYERDFIGDGLTSLGILKLNFASAAFVIRFFAFFHAGGVLTRNKRRMVRCMRERRLDYIVAIKAFDGIVLCRLCSVGTVRRFVLDYVAVFALVIVLILV